VKRGWERELEQATRDIGAVIKPWFVGGARELLEIAYEPGPGEIPDAQGLVAAPTGHLVVRVVGDKPQRLDPDQPAVAGEGQPIGEPPPDDGAEPLFTRENLRDEEPDPEPGTPSTAAIPDVDVLIARARRVRRRGTSQPSPNSIGALERIDHIVVLMQENRSFDHILGYLSREAGRSDVDGLNTLPPDPATNAQVNRYDHLNYFPTRAEQTAWPSLSTPGPGHETENVVAQVADNMGGFVASWAGRLKDGSPYLGKVMEYFGADQLPVYAALAEEFTICDRWFCAHPGPTWPNRFVLLTGDLSADANGSVEINNPDTRRMVPRTAPTLFDRLTEKGVSWRVFEHGYSFPRLFANWTYDVANIVPFEDPDIGFEATARSGLPAVTLIEPDYIDAPPGNDDHPPGDVADGQELVGRIVKALVSSPSWEKTLFVITYDEHGGFYDHVLPPDGLAPLRGEGARAGPRVPSFVISPLVARGGVLHTQFDHTSIGATILRRFYGDPLPPMSARMAAADDLREAISLDTPRPTSDFERFRQWTAREAAESPRNPALRNERITPPADRDDFHALLQIVRLMSGNP
jgi:phospholipase C